MLESSGILETYSFFGQIEAFFKQKPQGILWKTQGFANSELEILADNNKYPKKPVVGQMNDLS